MRTGYFYPSLIAVFALICVLAAADLVADVREGTQPLHVVVEAAVIVLSLGAAMVIARYLIRQLGRARSRAADLAASLESSHREAEQWQREARHLLNGLGAAIDRQFEAWCLTSAEKEVALLLLKGLSHKEVAGIRDVSEATARQQARSVYKKAGVAGRRDLAAFFLEHLTLPFSSQSDEGHATYAGE